MTPEAKEHFDKAHQCLSRARAILDAGIGEDAGRNAYLAAFHAAQALIAERTGKDAKTHRGVHSQFARLTRNEPRLGRELRQFLALAYDIKSIADYGLGPQTDVPLDRATAAIETAEQFVNCVMELLT
ncbi:MAG TPA: HEPN domain-containing protein [Stellaceae bacterium]